MKRVLTTLLKSVCIIALVLCGMDAQAQGNLVTGAVRDAKGEPVIGATVIVKGTATGATSGADGRYSIQAGPDATLEFSFIGYKKQEVPVGTRSAIDVVLEEDALMVDDVVVIGYGTQSRRTITAAVSKVDGEKRTGQLHRRCPEGTCRRRARIVGRQPAGFRPRVPDSRRFVDQPVERPDHYHRWREP